jgi:hypothetical protein
METDKFIIGLLGETWIEYCRKRLCGRITSNMDMCPDECEGKRRWKYYRNALLKAQTNEYWTDCPYCGFPLDECICSQEKRDEREKVVT